jgi:hypothetical protein
MSKPLGRSFASSRDVVGGTVLIDYGRFFFVQSPPLQSASGRCGIRSVSRLPEVRNDALRQHRRSGKGQRTIVFWLALRFSWG